MADAFAGNRDGLPACWSAAPDLRNRSPALTGGFTRLARTRRLARRLTSRPVAACQLVQVVLNGFDVLCNAGRSLLGDQRKGTLYSLEPHGTRQGRGDH